MKGFSKISLDDLKDIKALTKEQKRTLYTVLATGVVLLGGVGTTSVLAYQNHVQEEKIALEKKEYQDLVSDCKKAMDTAYKSRKDTDITLVEKKIKGLNKDDKKAYTQKLIKLKKTIADEKAKAEEEKKAQQEQQAAEAQAVQSQNQATDQAAEAQAATENAASTYQASASQGGYVEQASAAPQYQAPATPSSPQQSASGQPNREYSTSYSTNDCTGSGTTGWTQNNQDGSWSAGLGNGTNDQELGGWIIGK